MEPAHLRRRAAAPEPARRRAAAAASRHRSASGDGRQMAHRSGVLDDLAAAMLASGDAAQAARLLGASAHVRETTDVVAAPYELPMQEATTKTARRLLGEPAWDAAFGELANGQLTEV